MIPKIYHGSRSTYFSLSYEGMRERISRSSLRTIPTLAERGGDWSNVVDQSGSPLPVFDPRSTRRNPAFNPALPVSMDNLEYIRDPFLGNRIPVDRIDPAVHLAEHGLDSILVLQLVTAGGTFPWQTIPEPLHPLHQVLPLGYVVTGLRHLIYGGTSESVGQAVAVLVCYLVAALLLTTIAAWRQRVWTPSRLKPELSL